MDESSTRVATDVYELSGAEAVSALFEGISISLNVPEVRRRVIVAFFANGVVFAALLFGALWGVWEWTADWVASEPSDSGWLDALFGWLFPVLGWIVRTLVTVVVLIAAPVIFKLVAAIVLPVFNEAVFDAARHAAGGDAGYGVGVKLGAAAALAVDVKRAVRFIVLLLAVSFFTWFGSILPLIGLLAPPLGLLASLWVGASAFGWELHAVHLERAGFDYAAQRAYVSKHRARVFRVGLVAMLLLMVPLVQVFFLTTNVAGAAVISARLAGAEPLK